MSTKYLDDNGLAYLWTKIKAYVVPQARTVNGKALSSNITLSASDVSAASSTHTHGNISNNGSVAGSSTIQSGDSLPVLEKTTKSLKGSNLAFGSSTTTYLRNDGTWGTPSGGGSITVDTALSTTSTNPVQNKVITAEMNNKMPTVYMDCGYVTVSSVGATSYKDETISFNHTFAGQPQVVIGLGGTLTAANTGAVSVSAMNTSTTGFTARVYNNSNASKNVLVRWIALYLP